MFRRTTTLPARPSIPNKEEILADLNCAPPNDVIFKCNSEKNTNGPSEILKTYKEFDENDFVEDDNSTNYEKVESFLKKIDRLKEATIQLNEWKSNLKDSEDNLMINMGRMKKEIKADH